VAELRERRAAATAKVNVLREWIKAKCLELLDIDVTTYTSSNGRTPISFIFTDLVCRRTLQGHTGKVYSLDWTFEKNRIVNGTIFKEIHGLKFKCFEVAKKRFRRDLVGHNPQVQDRDLHMKRDFGLNLRSPFHHFYIKTLFIFLRIDLISLSRALEKRTLGLEFDACMDNLGTKTKLTPLGSSRTSFIRYGQGWSNMTSHQKIPRK